MHLNFVSPLHSSSVKCFWYIFHLISFHFILFARECTVAIGWCNFNSHLANDETCLLRSSCICKSSPFYRHRQTMWQWDREETCAGYEIHCTMSSTARVKHLNVKRGWRCFFIFHPNTLLFHCNCTFQQGKCTSILKVFLWNAYGFAIFFQPSSCLPVFLCFIDRVTE